MREIKFRFYDKENKKMLNDLDVFELTVNQSLKSDDELAVMQFTGLKDRNGVEIYEGDIVRWGMNGQELSGVRYAVVNMFPSLSFDLIFYENEETKERKKGSFSFKYDSFIYTNTENYLEVVANIYENKELLNEEN